MTDRLRISQHAGGSTTLTGDKFLAADVNGDSMVNSTDYDLVSDYCNYTDTGFYSFY